MVAKTPPSPRRKVPVKKTTAARQAPAKKTTTTKRTAAKETTAPRRRTTPTLKLGPRGRRLYSALIGPTATEPQKVLAEEAARIADRLDELDSIIHGNGVLNLMRFRSMLPHEDEMGDKHLTVKVEFSSVLSEARGQAATLKQILTTLGVEQATAAPPAAKGTGLDELKRRRRERQAQGQVRT